VYAYAQVELTDRFVAWFDHRSPMHALAYSPVKEGNDLPALQSVIAKAADQMGCDAASLLRQYPEIRLAVHDAAHILHRRKGEAFGLILSEALVKPAKEIFSLLGLSEQLLHPLPDFLPLDPAEIRKAVNHFLYCGAKSVAICLDQDASSQSREEEIRSILHQAYPSHYLGSIPVLMPPACPAWKGQQRLDSVIVSGYVRAALAQHIRSMIQFLRWMGFRGRFAARDVNGQYAPVAQCDPWSFYAETCYRFQDAVRAWIEEHSVASGIAVCYHHDTVEIAIIGNGRIQSDPPSLSSRITLSALALPAADARHQSGHSGGHPGRDWTEEDDRRLWQWADRLIPEIRKAAVQFGLQLLSATPLFIYGNAGGLAGCAIAERLGIQAFHMHLGRKLDPSDASDFIESAEMEGPLFVTSYESLCRVLPGWKMQHPGNMSNWRLRRVR
jgi:hypothetical protein